MSQSNQPVVPKTLLLPFILVTLLFPLWGFANDITNPMVAAFKNILLLSNTQSTLVQAAFYGGYALMAIPAALFIKRFSYRSGVLVGLGLYAIGCLLFIPSGWSLTFAPFLAAYLIMTCGLSFLETTANPYVLALGAESTATRRLNLSQAFNPMGSITGMFVASMFILINLDGTSEDGRRAMLAVSEGQLVHTRLVRQLDAKADALEEIVSQNGWESNKVALKRVADITQSLKQESAILADPRYEQARELSAALANQPQGNKFDTAIKAVAVVLQLRDKDEASPAEVSLEETFFSPSGLELALQLGRERKLPELATATQKVAPTWNSIAENTARLEQKLASQAYADIPSLTKQLTRLLSDQSSLQGVAPPDAYKSAITTEFKSIQQADLNTVVGPYATMGALLLGVLALFAWKLPKKTDAEQKSPSTENHTSAIIGRLIKNWNYLGGVIAQTFYVGAQIMCWTFIIQYAEGELGLTKTTAQNCNILAMIIFVSSRFVCTFFLKYISPGRLLLLLSIGGICSTSGTIFLQGYPGLYCLIATSACMSLMFPTIYGIALDGLGDDAKLGSSGLILAIGGGCLMPMLQAAIIDRPAFDLGFMELASVRASFALPCLCFVVIAFYGALSHTRHIRKESLVKGESISA